MHAERKPIFTKPSWQHYRVIHSKYPPANLYSSSNSENYQLGILASDTSSRLGREPSTLTNGVKLTPRELSVAQEDIRYGEGWGAVMASFSYAQYGRYSTDDIGAYYCADSSRTALKEWAYHTQKYWANEMGYTNEVSAVVRCYKGSFEQPLLDVRGDPLLHTDSYTEPQKVLSNAISEKYYGILYDSVRDKGGQCAALLRAPATTKVVQSAHYTLLFNGERFTDYSKISQFSPL